MKSLIIKKSRLVLYAVIFTPYITFGLFQSDLSPFYLVILIIFFGKAYTKDLYFFSSYGLLTSLLIPIAILMNGELDIRILKFLTSLLLVYLLYRIGQNYRDDFKNINWTIISVCWFTVGLAAFINPKLFDIFIFRVGHTIGRGSPGLTAEPSLYGLNGVFLYFLIVKYSQSAIAKSLLFASILLSASAYAVCVLVVLLVAKKHYKIMISLVSLAVVSVIYLEIDLRLLDLIRKLLTLDLNRLSQDVSIMFRLSNFVYIYQVTIGVADKISSLESSLTILFNIYDIFAYFVIILIVVFHQGVRSFITQSLSPSSFAVLLVIMVIGPLAIPMLWLLIGVESANTRNHTS
ncbi:hypothetical protein N8446_09180 [Planktomarina temperata]|nr:hypothetical protein [Planktomarina temperata]